MLHKLYSSKEKTTVYIDPAQVAGFTRRDRDMTEGNDAPHHCELLMGGTVLTLDLTDFEVVSLQDILGSCIGCEKPWAQAAPAPAPAPTILKTDDAVSPNPNPHPKPAKSPKPNPANVEKEYVASQEKTRRKKGQKPKPTFLSKS